MVETLKGCPDGLISEVCRQGGDINFLGGNKGATRWLNGLPGECDNDHGRKTIKLNSKNFQQHS